MLPEPELCVTRFIKDNKIVCCEKDNYINPDESERSVLEKTVCELEEDSEMKNKFIDKLKREYKLFVEEAMRNEEELNRLVQE